MWRKRQHDSEQCALHKAACGISAADTGAAETSGAIVHVSGQPLASRQHHVSVSAAGEEALQQVCFSTGGHQLHYSTKVLGSGGYAHVLWGQEVLALSVTDLAARLSQVIASQKTFSLLWPWLSSAHSVLLHRNLIKAPVQLLASLSDDVRKRAFKLVQQLGLVCVVPDALLDIKPCAVKVLTQRSCDQGAYGKQSAENEVLISLHVSQACADCPYVGKAHGFEYAVARPLPALLPGTIAKWLAPPPAALLLALEPYTIDLEAALAAREARLRRHAGMGPRRCSSADLSPRSLQPCATVPEDSCTDACVVGGSRRQPVNLWEYLVWLRSRHQALTVAEMRTLALQLAKALHSLHTQAHVMHLDVKPHNCLLTDSLELRLVDFGFAAAFQPEQPFITVPRSGRGTPHFTAPEMGGQTPRLITPAADIYSFGCCLLTICASSYLIDPCAAVLAAPAPYAGAFAEVAGAVPALQLPWQVPEPFRKLIQRCLKRQPSGRPDAAAVIAALEAIPGNLVLPAPQFDLVATPPEQLPCQPANLPLLGTWHSNSGNIALVERPGATRPPRTSSSSGAAGGLSAAAAGKSPRGTAIHGASHGSSGSSASGSGLLCLALSAMSSHLSNRSSGSTVCPDTWGNSIAPEELGASPQLQQLCVAGRCTSNMRYTKSVRQDLAAVMRPAKRASIGAICRQMSDDSPSRSLTSSSEGGSMTIVA